MAQELKTAGIYEGEHLIRRCPKERSEALQWTSFLLHQLGQKDRSITLDRLLMPTPKGRGVLRIRQLAEAGSYGLLQERLMPLIRRYTKDISHRLLLGRALARAGNFEAARREYFTYLNKKPQDVNARIEYLYLHVWAGQSALALSDSRTLSSVVRHRETRAAAERGIRLVSRVSSDLNSSTSQQRPVGENKSTLLPGQSMPATPAPPPAAAPVDDSKQRE